MEKSNKEGGKVLKGVREEKRKDGEGKEKKSGREGGKF